MYESGILDAFLKAHDLDQVRCETDWGRIVKDKYKKLTEESGETVADARCPMASGLVKDVMKVAKIEPILIHCAREISGREEGWKEDHYNPMPFPGGYGQCTEVKGYPVCHVERAA